MKTARLTSGILWCVLACGVLAGPRSMAVAHEGPLATPIPAGPVIATSTVSFDAFRGDRLDSKRWNVIERAGSGQETNRPELQYYTPDSVTVDKGALHLSARRVEKLDPISGKVFAYSSGRIESTARFTYGKIEVRAKLPSGPGFWPAIWLRTPTRDGPLAGEIDIVNGFGSKPEAIESAVETYANGKLIAQNCLLIENFTRADSCQHIGNPLEIAYDLSRNFHTYTLDWKASSITWSIDGYPYWTVTKNIPRVPMIVVLDLAVGGPHDGPPARSTRWPGVMDVASVAISR